MKNELELKPTYWASVSGGKDSLFMLKLILSYPEKYQLNGVVHFELEIDYPFIKNVVDYMEEQCKRFNIPFVRIKPRQSYYDLLNKNGFPTRKARWCNGYKLDALKQLKEFMKEKGYKVYSYVGYCYDEFKRYDKRKNYNEIYPLVEHQIIESDVLDWAKNITLFNDFYKFNTRCGCMYCPMMNKINMAYLCKYYPSNFDFMIAKAKETEKIREKELGRPFSVWASNPKYNTEYMEKIIKEKYLPKLEEIKGGLYDD